MKATTRRFHWWTLAVLSAVLIIGTTCAFVSNNVYRAPIALAEGETVTIPTFRVLPTKVRLRLEIKHQPVTRRDRRNDELPDDSATIRIQVNSCQELSELRALPARSSLQQSSTRDFAVWDGVEHPYPNKLSLLPKLPAGHCELAVKILEVDGALTGRKANFVLQPPMTFKRMESSYRFLWFFAFGWPYLTLALILYSLIFAALLAWDTSPRRANAAARQ